MKVFYNAKWDSFVDKYGHFRYFYQDKDLYYIVHMSDNQITKDIPKNGLLTRWIND